MHRTLSCLNSDGCTNVFVGFIPLHEKVFVSKIEDRMDSRVDDYPGKFAGFSGELEVSLLQVVCVEVGITSNPSEYSWHEITDLCNHHQQESIACDVEGHSQLESPRRNQSNS